VFRERFESPNLVRLKRCGQTRHRGEGHLDLAEPLLLGPPPFLEEGLAQRLFWQHAIHHDGVTRQLE